ncbi:hypothetical protein BDV97DRAFT_87687 [Delphinella strobiligena]|nr:hypothetical protein BDV97DRAFT_87687 [Delphinella strobiligena]
MMREKLQECRATEFISRRVVSNIDDRTIGLSILCYVLCCVTQHCQAFSEVASIVFRYIPKITHFVYLSQSCSHSTRKSPVGWSGGQYTSRTPESLSTTNIPTGHPHVRSLLPWLMHLAAPYSTKFLSSLAGSTTTAIITMRLSFLVNRSPLPFFSATTLCTTQRPFASAFLSISTHAKKAHFILHECFFQ